MVDPDDLPEHMRACPIEVAIGYIGKKWAVNIVRDLFVGKKRFSQFLHANPQLSTKMLSTRLKELEKEGFITKRVVSTNPIYIEYALTTKGRALNGILLELSVFSFRYCASEVYKRPPITLERDIELMRKVLKVGLK